MIFKSDKLQQVKLVMFEKTDMPSSDMKEVDGKKVFVKNGKFEEMTTYTLRDGFGNKIVTMSKNNDFRALEGEIVDVELDLVFNDFTRKTQVRLLSLKKASK